MPSRKTPSIGRRGLLAAVSAVAALITAPLHAGVPDASPPPPLSAADMALVDRATGYLQSLTGVKGAFVQTDARGNVAHGELYLMRPGRARFAYDPPSSLVVISDGRTVSVSDPRLQTVNRYPLWATPLSLFLARQVRLDRGVAVTHVDRFSDGFALTARDAKHKTQGEITLTFGGDPLSLREWSMTDGQGRTTRVKLSDLQTVSDLDPGLFKTPGPKSTPDPATF